MDRILKADQHRHEAAVPQDKTDVLIGGSRLHLDRLQGELGHRYNPVVGRPRLRTHNQKMTVAAMQMALMNVWAQRSYRVAMRRQSLSLPNMRSMRFRCL
jgi:hypothetical protein